MTEHLCVGSHCCTMHPFLAAAAAAFAETAGLLYGKRFSCLSGPVGAAVGLLNALWPCEVLADDSAVLLIWA